MNRVYLSGPITGMPNENREAFFSAQLQIFKATNFRISVSNPFLINHETQNPTYKDYLRDAIVAMLECDAIVMLPGWANSRGACIERAVAHACGLKIYPSVDKMLEEYHG